MSDSARSNRSKSPDVPVSMSKKPPSSVGKMPAAPAGTAGGKASVAAVPRPATIQWASIAVVAQIVFTLAQVIAVRGYTSEFTAWLIRQNDKATGKDHKAPYTAADIAHDLHSLRNAMLSRGLMACLALVILAVALRRSGSSGIARWAPIFVIFFLNGGPMAIYPMDGLPTVPRVAGVLMGAASLAVIILMLLPQSSRYFRECRAAAHPGAAARPGLAGMLGGRTGAGTPARSGPARPGGARPGSSRPAGTRPGGGGLLGSLFAPRPAPGARGPAGRDAGAAGRPSRPGAKAKVRADAESAAKNSEPSRPASSARARSSKSRRTDAS